MTARDLDPFEAVLEFHRKFGVHVGPRPGLPPDEIVALRRALIEEETRELDEAIRARDFVEVADALADLLYVVYGTAVSFGLDIRPVFAEVHRSNMAKVGGGTRADGKVLKPEGWKPPDIGSVLVGAPALSAAPAPLDAVATRTTGETAPGPTPAAPTTEPPRFAPGGSGEESETSAS